MSLPTRRNPGPRAPATVATLVVFLLSAVLLVAPVTSSAAPMLSPAVIWVPQEYHTGGAYTAIQAASDGRVYLGTTYYDGFGRFLVLPPGGNAFQLITDTATATGERTPGPYAQAKIHTKPAIAPDGKVYFGTKSGKPAADQRWQANYPGGHLLVYDPQSGKVTDLGIPRPRQSIIAVGVDPRRNIVYALTDAEGHLITYDPRARTFADKGLFIPQGPPSRYLPVLSNGDAFHQAGADAYNRYTAAAGRIERLPLQFTGRGRYEPPYAVAPGWDGTRFYGVGEESGQVYTFSPEERGIGVQLHGAAGGSGGNHYTITLAPDDNLYYAATYSRASLAILRLVTKTGTPEVLGQVAALPPPPAGFRGRADRIMVQGSTAGPDGTVYVMLAYPLRVLVFPKLAR